MAKGIGRHPPFEEPGAAADPVEGQQRADGCRTVALLAERGEVVSPQQAGGGSVHRGHIERASVEHGVVAPQRVQRRRVITDAVAVVPGQCRESGVEAGRRRRDPMDDDIGREQPAQPQADRLLRRAISPPGERGIRLRINVGMRDLAAGMHPGVGATGDGEAHRLRRAQQRRQCRGELPLDGSAPRLGRPPRERGAVVPEVKAQAQHPGRLPPHERRPASREGWRAVVANQAGVTRTGNRPS